jgi:hypothetical protein
MVGAEHAGSGEMMFVSSAEGQLVAVAFGDGDGNWDNERDAIANGIICVGGAALTGFSSGTLAWIAGAVAAAECYNLMNDLGDLYQEYRTDNLRDTYTQTQNVFLNDEGWDGWYDFEYEDGSGWFIYYDDETGTWSDWVWKENVKQEAG